MATITKTKLGVDDYDHDIIEVKSDEMMKFFCEHCYAMEDTVYYDIGVIWCKLCKDTLNLEEYEKQYRDELKSKEEGV